MRVSCSTLQRRAFLPSHGASETGPLPRCHRPLNSLVLGGLPGAPELGSPRDKRILDEGLRLLVFMKSGVLMISVPFSGCWGWGGGK